MSKYHVFVSQTGSLAPASLNVTGTYSYYANASGALMVKLSDLSTRQAATNFATTGAREVVSTGLGVFSSVGVSTGLFYGNTGLYQYPTLLGAPNFWIQAFGPQGQLLALPAYTRSA
jgi:hypothetical protein